METGHAGAVRTGIGDQFFGILAIAGAIDQTPNMRFYSKEAPGRAKTHDLTTDMEAWVPKASFTSELVTLEEGQIVIVRGDSTYAEISSNERLRKSTIPHELDLPEGVSVTAVTAHALLDAKDVWIPIKEEARISRFPGQP